MRLSEKEKKIERRSEVEWMLIFSFSRSSYLHNETATVLMNFLSILALRFTLQHSDTTYKSVYIGLKKSRTHAH